MGQSFEHYSKRTEENMEWIENRHTSVTENVVSSIGLAADSAFRRVFLVLVLRIPGVPGPSISGTFQS